VSVIANGSIWTLNLINNNNKFSQDGYWKSGMAAEVDGSAPQFARPAVVRWFPLAQSRHLDKMGPPLRLGLPLIFRRLLGPLLTRASLL
jgi:hypothetical protein